MHRLRNGLHRFCMQLTYVSEALAAILLVVIVVINSLAVFYRYGLHNPIGWTEEAMRYAVVWATFFGASAALYRGEHMVLNLFESVPSVPLRLALHYIVFGCIAVFCVIVISAGLPLAIRNWHQDSPTMNIPMFWPYFAVIFGLFLMLLKTISLLIMPPGFAVEAFEVASVAADVDPSDT